MEENDIIEMDNRIHIYFASETKKLEELRTRVEELNDIIKTIHDDDIKQLINEQIQSNEKNIADIETNSDYYFYISETMNLIDRYKTILKTPVKISFSGVINKTNNIEKEAIIDEYLQISSKYLKYIDINVSKKGVSVVCEDCRSKKIIYNESIITCLDCGSEKEIHLKTSSKNSPKLVCDQKYIEERKVHFRACLNQFQGKQNSKIDDKIFRDLEKEFVKNKLIAQDQYGIGKYSKIKFEHIMLFLRELGYDKQYENAKYIYSKITGIKCPDLTPIEDKLLSDFDIFVNLYMREYKYENKLERKSFINIQYILFQLLNKNDWPCDKNDFMSILKTNDRKAYHDEIVKTLFEKLEWKHTPLF